MRSGLAIARAALAVTALVCALALVVWRQARAREVLGELDRLRRERAVMLADRADLERRIQVLESRGHVLPEASRRLDLRMPDATEIVILPGVVQ